MEKLPVSTMTVIVSSCASGKKPPHDRGNGNKPRSKQNVFVIWQQDPRVASGLGFTQYITYSVQEIIPVQIILKDLFSFNPPDDGVWRAPGARFGLV